MESLRGFIERVGIESRRLGIPSIDGEDGLVLYTASLLTGSRLPSLVAADLGAGIGYSTAWIAAGLEDGCSGSCRLYAVEVDRGLCERGRELFAGAPLERVRVEWVCGDAVTFLDSLPAGSLGLAFVDVAKREYPRILETLGEKLAVGGAALFHNAYFPRPPERFYEMMRRPPWRGGVAPTPAGLAVLVREG